MEGGGKEQEYKWQHNNVPYDTQQKTLSGAFLRRAKKEQTQKRVLTSTHHKKKPFLLSFKFFKFFFLAVTEVNENRMPRPCEWNRMENCPVEEKEGEEGWEDVIRGNKDNPPPETSQL